MNKSHPLRTPRAAAEAAIARDNAHADTALWITRRTDADLRARAAALEEEGPRGRKLWGLTVAVKDNIDVAGLPTTAACPAYAYTPQASAPAVAKLEEAGALILGKTNLDQFATGLVGVRSPYGIPRNVHDAARIPGGSSSGSATAVAAGIADLALGTDTAGSGRVPAMFGGIVGLKPTIGSVSTTGMVPACRSIDTISIFAPDIAAALTGLSIIAGYDAADPYSRPAPHPHLRTHAPGRPWRIATAEVAPYCAPAVTEAYAAATAAFETTRTDLSAFLEIARLLYDGPWVAERTAALRQVIEDQPEALHKITRIILEGGFSRSAVDAFDAFHKLAQARRIAAGLFARVDALALPTAPFTPTLAEVAADPIGVNARLGVFTNFVNLCDLAAIAVPIGQDADGLPASITLIGPAWSEGKLAAIAATLQGTSIPPSPLAPDETALFCIGAHMAGLPLNGQITALGGRFLRAAETAPAYRLFALGNRPGLIRGGAGKILGEVWALPTAAIGALLAQVPPPLGFGTVELADGPCLGFLAESHALADAKEITQHGGWRAWRATQKETT